MSPSYRLRAVAAAIALAGVTVVTFGGATSSAAASRVKAPQTKTVAATDADCGGEAAYNSDGSPMTCTFDDEFDATTGDAKALDTSKWVPQLSANSGYTTGASGNQACYVN